MEKQMNEIMAENRKLTEPLQKAREEVQELQKEVSVTCLGFFVHTRLFCAFVWVNEGRRGRMYACYFV